MVSTKSSIEVVKGDKLVCTHFAEIILSKLSWNMSPTLSVLVIIGAQALMMVTCLLPDLETRMLLGGH